jgi:hypothetical protein
MYLPSFISVFLFITPSMRALKSAVLRLILSAPDTNDDDGDNDDDNDDVELIMMMIMII